MLEEDEEGHPEASKLGSEGLHLLPLGLEARRLLLLPGKIAEYAPLPSASA